MWCKHSLAIFHPSLHIGTSFVDFAVGNPVLSDLSQELQVSNGDFISTNELFILQEVGLYNVQRYSQCRQGLCTLCVIPWSAVLDWSKSLEQVFHTLKYSTSWTGTLYNLPHYTYGRKAINLNTLQSALLSSYVKHCYIAQLQKKFLFKEAVNLT